MLYVILGTFLFACAAYAAHDLRQRCNLRKELASYKRAQLVAKLHSSLNR